VDGEPYVDVVAVKEATVHFYDNLYHEEQLSRLFLMVLLLSLLVLKMFFKFGTPLLI